MKKSGRKVRREMKAKNLAELKILKDQLCLEVVQFNGSHLRIIGKQAVDYWPGTGRAWPLGSSEKGRVVTPAEVCGMALL